MKCLNCGTEVSHRHSRLCEDCAGEMIERLQIHTEPRQKDPTTLQTSSSESTKRNRKIVPNPILMPLRDILPAKRKSSWLNVSFFLRSFFSFIAIGLFIYFIFLPYRETSLITNTLQEKLPDVETGFSNVINSLQDLSGTNLHTLPQANQIGTIDRLIHKLALVEPIGPTDSLFQNLKGFVAGVQTGIPLSYDPDVTQLYQQIQTGNAYLTTSYQAFAPISAASQTQTNYRLSADLMSALRKMVESGNAFIDETKIVLDYFSFNLELSKRMDDMGIGLEQAFASENPQVISDSLDEIVSELASYDEEFSQLPKPQGSEELSLSISSTIEITATFFREVSTSIKISDIPRMVGAANQYLADSAQFDNRSNDDIQNFWDHIGIGSLYSTWVSDESALENKLDEVLKSPAFRFMSTFPIRL